MAALVLLLGLDGAVSMGVARPRHAEPSADNGLPMIRAELHSANHQHLDLQTVEMMDSGAMHIIERKARQPPAPMRRKSGDFGGKGAGLQEVARKKSQPGAQEWKKYHDSKEGTNEDDWDDEATKSGAKNQAHSQQTWQDGDPNSNAYDDSYGDGDQSAYDGVDMPTVNITAEEDATAPAASGPLKAADARVPVVEPPENDVEKLGEGIGAMAYERSPSGSRSVNRELRKRLELQDFATVVLLLTAFGATVLLSCCSVYQVSDDPSPAAYYSEPRNYQQRVICETNDVDTFLAAFNTQPQNVRLRVTGKNPEPGGFRTFLRTLNAHTTTPRGLAALLPMRQRRRLSVLFDVSLDLSPFITGDGRMSEENLQTLQKYLNTSNNLESVILQKRVDWPQWEDVATNIRQRLRTLGFPGDVEVRFEAADEVLIYQNRKWSNFVRNRVTQALVVISIIGSAFWLPYVWVRSKKTKVETRFQISVDPARYWELVADGLSAAEGFQSM